MFLSMYKKKFKNNSLIQLGLRSSGYVLHHKNKQKTSSLHRFNKRPSVKTVAAKKSSQ